MVLRPPAPQRLLRLSAVAVALLAMGGQFAGATSKDGSKLPAAAGDSAIPTDIHLKAPAVPEAFKEKESSTPKDEAKKKSDSAIPEPAAAALGLLGLGLIIFRRYRV